VHGAHHRIFTDAEEARLVEVIITEYIAKGRKFIASTFQALAQDAYAQTERDPEGFQCSTHFIADFKKRHAFSSRRFHMRRRNQHCGRLDIEQWVERTKILLSENSHHRVVNCDETMWRVVPNGMLTWAPVGEDSVSVDLDADAKAGITVLASVTAAHEKLPLFLIAKGKTNRVEETQLGVHEGCQAAHSPSGWTTVHPFRQYLEWLRAFYADSDPIHLILDAYSVHRSQDPRNVARELHIELHFIPPGWTDELHKLLEEDELRDAILLVYANKQDLPNAIKPQELGNRLRLNSITNRAWQVQGTCATTGDGLYEGLDWLGEQINTKF
jgi:hypothetical protein